MSRLKLDSLIIIDLEATCWPENLKPPEQHSEIIEIGICTFDLMLWSIAVSDTIVVIPTQSEVSKYCTDLTGWTQKALEESGVLLKDACKTLTGVYNTKQHVWASWGDYDRIQFERECSRKDLSYPFGKKHINLKTLFAIHYELKREVGMMDALKLCKLGLEGCLHSGRDDAWNLGRILEAQGRF